MDFLPIPTAMRSSMQAELEELLALANQRGASAVDYPAARYLSATLKSDHSSAGPSSTRRHRTKALTRQVKAKQSAKVAMKAKASRNDSRRRLGERAAAPLFEAEETSHPEDGSDDDDVPLAHQYPSTARSSYTPFTAFTSSSPLTPFTTPTPAPISDEEEQETEVCFPEI
jgi:hypothetical protein